MVNSGSWKTIRLGKQGILLSHLFFADDLLLFGKASKEQCRIVKSVLNDFYVSFEKKKG